MPSLFHYTDQKGLTGILRSDELWASTIAKNPRDVRYGDGQYLSDVEPGTMTAAQLSRALIGHPFGGRRFTHFVEIDVTGLTVVNPRSHVFVIPGGGPLDLSQRILRNGAN
jgi:hypothetical protein